VNEQATILGRAKLPLSPAPATHSAGRAPSPPEARLITIYVFVVLAALVSTFSIASAADSKSDPIQTAKDALASGGRFPWYDRKQDGVRRLSIVPRVTPKDRGQKWSSTPQTTTTTTTPVKLPRLNLVSSALQWLGLTLLIVLLGVIAYLIATSFLKDELLETGTERKVVQVRHDADRVEALPFKVRAATTDFLAEARRLFDAGQYSEAIIYLFSHELVELDRHQVIRLAKGKTNRQYLRETRFHPLLASVLETTMIAFEDAFFGNKQLSRDVFERSWSRLNEFKLELERRVAA
jgi:hypothetical protein